jgi:hypothetical protein
MHRIVCLAANLSPISARHLPDAREKMAPTRDGISLY